MNKNRLEETAGSVYSFMMHSQPDSWGDHAWTDWAMNINKWDWNGGVSLIAAGEYGRSAGGRAAIQDIEAWIARNIEQSELVKVVNSIAPFAVFPQLFHETGQSFYAQKSGEIARWLMEVAPRTKSGAFEHTVTERASFSEQIWADTIFMAVLFLARTARLMGDTNMAQEALQQVLLHLRALQDEETGLLYHGWNYETSDWMSAAKWNRANAWNAVGIPMIMEETADLGQDSGLLGEIKERYHRLAEGLVKSQQANGMWPTVLDRPLFYEETSGSAGIACGLYKAAHSGLVPKSMMDHADRTAAAVLNEIRTDGSVGGVSGGTPVLASIEAYNEVPIFPTLYGQGLTLLLLTEVMNQNRV